MVRETLPLPFAEIRPWMRAALLVVLTLTLSALFGELYHLFGTSNLPLWRTAAWVNSVVALPVVVWVFARGLGSSVFTPLPENPKNASRFGRLALAYGPAVLVVVGSLALVGLSLAVAGPAGAAGAGVPWAWILWIPVVEEVVFRLGVGGAFRHLGGPWLGSWFSALVFAMVHAAPRWNEVFSFELGLPLGPFLLGLLCEGLVVLTARIWPAILLHSACNATVVIFSWGDPRWLGWLSFLYLEG